MSDAGTNDPILTPEGVDTTVGSDEADLEFEGTETAETPDVLDDILDNHASAGLTDDVPGDVGGVGDPVELDADETGSAQTER